jgi:hypothetical protein
VFPTLQSNSAFQTVIARGSSANENDTWGSIEQQSLPKLTIIHGCKIILRIDLSRADEEELIKRLKCARTQRIDGASQGDLGKEQLGAWDSHHFEVVRKYPRSI